MNEKMITKLFRRTTSSKNIKEAVFMVESTSGDYTFCKEYNRTIDTPMLMASITKLLTTTCILAMMQEGKINLKDKISDYLPNEIIKGLHICKGIEYSYDITIENLLFQTSGLPDYYLDGKIFSRIKHEDFSFSFEQELIWTRSIKAKFVPSTHNRAYYADINFDLLGRIIEKILGVPLQKAFEKYIFSPLSLKNTYLASVTEGTVPYVYFKNELLKRPKFVSSCFASGGSVTTARDLMIFIKAFYGGKLFNKSVFEKLKKSNPLQFSFYPIHYSGGYMMLEASILLSSKIKLLGHAGSTGSFAFYAPEKDLFFVGDLAQMASPSKGVRFVMQSAILS